MKTAYINCSFAVDLKTPIFIGLSKEEVEETILDNFGDFVNANNIKIDIL